MLRHEDVLFSNVFCISLPPKVQRTPKGKWWLWWLVRWQKCNVVCRTDPIPRMCKIYFEHSLSSVAFLVKLSDDLSKLAFMLHVGYARPNWVIPSPTRIIQNLCKFGKNCSMECTEKISFWKIQPQIFISKYWMSRIKLKKQLTLRASTPEQSSLIPSQTWFPRILSKAFSNQYWVYYPND